MGHVSRAFEAAGLPTVVIATAVFEGRLRAMQVPRLLLTPFWMGRPLGQPHDVATQLDVVRAGLKLLETAVAAPTIHHYKQ